MTAPVGTSSDRSVVSPGLDPSWQYTQFQSQVLAGTGSTPRLLPRRREGTGPNTYCTILR